ncbi:hypothetical protein QFZ34_001539 [Phyllobacterium ifriqiyense]|uniref:Uncharacterized protein n=1 Tax=Phyllobacterium ifriqiyense TaxID=314238 RepID=A0ABU0S6I5_9HYPH|nr:hypothetical protein [Phyllobacterium ifriqiyense]
MKSPFAPLDLTVDCIHRSSATRGTARNLSSAIEAEYLLTGNCYARVVCESAEAKSLRALLLSKAPGRSCHT